MSTTTRSSLLPRTPRLALAAISCIALASTLTGCNNASEGALSGAALGALAGLGLGSLSGDAGKGAAAGAIIGGLGGAVLGDQNARHSAPQHYGQRYHYGHRCGSGY
jgi:Glycine zipper